MFIRSSIEKLNAYNLSHVFLMRQFADLSGTPIAALAGDAVVHHFRKIYHGQLILNVGISREHATELIAAGLGDFVAFGREYIANTAAERFWSPDYIQHSAHIEPGRDGLFNLIKSIPPTLRYEPGVIVVEGDLVIIHGRFSGFGLPVNWIAVDIIRMKDGLLVEHWDVIQDEATKEQSKSGNPMFGDTFPERG
jgi:predicted SnoaL-like aldol condensation-catalyzing enzyme